MHGSPTSAALARLPRSPPQSGLQVHRFGHYFVHTLTRTSTARAGTKPGECRRSTEPDAGLTNSFNTAGTGRGKRHATLPPCPSSCSAASQNSNRALCTAEPGERSSCAPCAPWTHHPSDGPALPPQTCLRAVLVTTKSAGAQRPDCQSRRSTSSSASSRSTPFRASFSSVPKDSASRHAESSGTSSDGPIVLLNS